MKMSSQPKSDHPLSGSLHVCAHAYCVCVCCSVYTHEWLSFLLLGTYMITWGLNGWNCQLLYLILFFISMASFSFFWFWYCKTTGKSGSCTEMLHQVNGNGQQPWFIQHQWTAGGSTNIRDKVCRPPLSFEIQQSSNICNWMAPGNNRLSAVSSGIFKYVRIHANFASQPVLREKMFLCCLSPKSREKRLQARKSTPTPSPLPLCPRMYVCQVFFPCFWGKTTQEHLFTSHRSACQVWVDSDILENFTRNGTNAVVARSHSIVYVIAVQQVIQAKQQFIFFVTQEKYDNYAWLHLFVIRAHCFMHCVSQLLNVFCAAIEAAAVFEEVSYWEFQCSFWKWYSSKALLPSKKFGWKAQQSLSTVFVMALTFSLWFLVFVNRYTADLKKSVEH